MSIYLCYARSKKEFEVRDELQALGIDVWCARQLRKKRIGRTIRDVVHYDAPYLPNFIFARIPDEKFLDVVAIDGLAPALTIVSEKEFAGWPSRETPEGLKIAGNPGVRGFLDATEAEYRERDEERRRGERRDSIAAEYEPGQAIRMLAGAFTDRALTFRGMVEGQDFPLIEATFELMGNEAKAYLDPLDVRAAE